MQKLLFLLALSLMFFSCQKEDQADKNCTEIETLCQAVWDDNEEATAEIIDGLTEDLTPVPTNNDELGQKDNLKTLVDRLNNCDCLKATQECYACMESFPPQSSIELEAKVDGEQVKRFIRVRTSETESLKFSGMN